MSSSAQNSVTPLVVVVALIVALALAALFVTDARILTCLVAVVIGAGLFCHHLFPANAAGQNPAGTESVARNIGESRNEVINAMSILQQEIRLLQSSNAGATEKKALRDEISHLATEIAALKQLVQTQRQ